MTDKGADAEGRNTLTYDLDNYASGTYFLSLKDGSNLKVMKVIVQK